VAFEMQNKSEVLYLQDKYATFLWECDFKGMLIQSLRVREANLANEIFDVLKHRPRGPSEESSFACQ